jgi:hypothetical protein
MRKLAAKIALTSLAFQYGLEFALLEQFDRLRNIGNVTDIPNLPVHLFANEGLMSAYLKSPHQHSVVGYLSAGRKEGWALVTLFGGISYLIVLTEDYSGRESKQFSVFYDAETRARFNPILLADEMTLVGHVLSPVTMFEQPSAVLELWTPMFTDFCKQKGFIVEPLQHSDSVQP